MTNTVNQTIGLLGLPATDRVTGFKGVVTSVCFDLYGCIQAGVTAGADKGKLGDSHWFDVKRLKIGTKRVMTAPSFTHNYGDENGPSDKPELRSMPVR